MRTAPRIALALLGVMIGWSAIQHWTGGPELVLHYREVGLGEAGRFAIAALQSVAGLGLLIRRTQGVSALVFASVMVAIATRNAVSGAPIKMVQPALLALWAALPAGALLVLQRRRAGGQASSSEHVCTGGDSAHAPSPFGVDDRRGQ
jgi:hypothetical protein